MLLGGLEHIEGAVDQDLEGEPRLLGALSDADCGLVEDQVAAAGEVVDKIDVSNVADDERQAWVIEDVAQVGLSTAYQVVEHADLGHTGREQLVHDRGADRSGAAGDQHRRASEGIDRHRTSSRTLGSRPEPTDLWPGWSVTASRTESTRRPAAPSVRGGRPSLIA